MPVYALNGAAALVIMLLAFALLEEDGVMLCIALGAAAISLAVTTAAIWGGVEVSAIWHPRVAALPRLSASASRGTRRTITLPATRSAARGQGQTRRGTYPQETAPMHRLGAVTRLAR